MNTVRPRVGAKGKVVQDLEFYKKKSTGPPLHQLSLLRYMSSKLCLQLNLHHELFLAKIFMMALSQFGVGLHFCLKDLGSLTLRNSPKFKNKILNKLKLKFWNLKTVSEEVQPKGFLVDLDER